MKNLTTLVTALLFITACNAQKRIKGNGNVVTIERTTSDYDGISASGFYDISLIDGNEGKIMLTGEDNILAYIETEVRGGTLVIKSKDNKNLMPSRGKSVSIIVTVEEIDRIRLSGSGNFIGKKTLKANDLDLRVSGSKNIDLSIGVTDISVETSGSSNIRLKGKSEELRVRSSGSSNVKGYELETDEASFILSGSSDVQITVNESLTSRVSGSGNISYKGNPNKIDTKTSGSGSVSKN